MVYFFRVLVKLNIFPEWGWLCFFLSLAYMLLEWDFGGLIFVAFLLELWTWSARC